MKFMKGMIIGGAATIGAMMMYNEMSSRNKKKIMKKGKKLIRKMGII